MTRQIFAPGAHLEIRDEVWRVVRVDQTSTGGKAIHVIGLSELVRDKSSIFLTEYERDIRTLFPEETDIVRDTSRGYSASLLFMESMLRRVAPTDARIHVGHRAAMDTMNFQLEPSWKALKSPRQRVLIADAVGLGKTLSAGILLSELIARGKGRRILVVGLKSMLSQLQKEFWGRFGIGLVRLDSVGLQKIRSQIPTHHNPFHHFDRAIVSIDTLKQNNAYRTYLEQAHWDVIVIDEAHNVAHRGSGRSQRARLADLLATRSDALIMLSATPHDGQPRSFASLMNMLDPTAIADPNAYTQSDVEDLYVRRFKQDVAEELKKNLPERSIQKIHAQASGPEEDVFATFSAMEWRSLDQGSHLVRTSFEKALLSSPMACAATVKNRRRKLEKKMKDHAEAGRDIQGLQHDVQTLQNFEQQLDRLDAAAFSKYQRMLTLVKKEMSWKKKADDRIVIFTERIETLKFLATQLSRDLSLSWGDYGKQDVSKDKLLVLDGSMNDIQQQAVVEAFGREKAKVRVLVASDVASEGINLHYTSHRMIHFDIPWSLMIFQQRNGRVDRYGQEKKPEIYYLLTDSKNAKIQGDQRILDILIEKDRQVQANIGDPCAFGGHTAEDQEKITAKAIEAGTDEGFMDEIFGDMDFFDDEDRPEETPGDAFDPFSLEDEIDAERTTVKNPLSVFPSDYAYVKTSLELMKPLKGISFSSADKEERIELEIPNDLKRRLTRALEKSVIPEDNRLLLSAKRDAIQEELRRARKEDGAWPALHFLWPLHPVMDWVADHMSAHFGRHSAPLLFLDREIGDEETVILLSALIPNRRGQPVLHKWFAARFQGEEFASLKAFEDFQSEVRLGEDPLVNRATSEEDHAEARAFVKTLLGTAVARVQARMKDIKAEFDASLQKDLKAHEARLLDLQDRKLSAIAQRDLLADRHDRQEKRIRQVFEDHKAWVRNALTTEPVPFVQVVAALQSSHSLRK